MMDGHVYRHAAHTDVAKRAGGSFSGMKGLVNFFTYEAPNVANSKALTTTDISMVTSYTREAYLVVSLILS